MPKLQGERLGDEDIERFNFLVCIYLYIVYVYTQTEILQPPKIYVLFLDSEWIQVEGKSDGKGLQCWTQRASHPSP